MSRHKQLSAEIRDGRLVIEIGVELLCFAVQVGINEAYDADEWRVTDADQFAEGIRTQLLREEEDGSTLIHRALDRAAVNALESGAKGIEEVPADDGQQPDEAA